MHGEETIEDSWFQERVIWDSELQANAQSHDPRDRQESNGCADIHQAQLFVVNSDDKAVQAIDE